MSSFKENILRNQGHSQRGMVSVLDQTVTLTSTAAWTECELDTAEQGGMSICWQISPPSANVSVKYQVSMDRVNWLDTATVDKDGSAQSSSGVTVSSGSTGYFILSIANDPQRIAFRYHRLNLTNASSTTNKVGVHGVVK